MSNVYSELGYSYMGVPGFTNDCLSSDLVPWISQLPPRYRSAFWNLVRNNSCFVTLIIIFLFIFVPSAHVVKIKSYQYLIIYWAHCHVSKSDWIFPSTLGTPIKLELNGFYVYCISHYIPIDSNIFYLMSYPYSEYTNLMNFCFTQVVKKTIIICCLLGHCLNPHWFVVE